MNRRRIREMWESYRRDVVPPQAGPEQVQGTMFAFYGGVLAYRQILLTQVSAGDGVTAEDEQLIADIEAELSEFEAQTKAMADMGRLDG